MTAETDAKLKEELLIYQNILWPLGKISAIITTAIMTLAFFDQCPWVAVVDGNGKSLALENRLLFTLQLSLIDLLPLFIAIFGVIDRRISTIAMNPMDPRGHTLVEQPQHILQNTLEQLIIKLILSLALFTVIQSNELMVLPVFTILFVLSRFTFALGYPNYRSFGITMDIISTVFVTILVEYRLFVEEALY